ncbi:MAG TPA: chemotaxis protein CheB [Haliangium sp.]|nr:chemotaxis protein CheB [Haliangium sp.]
MTSTFQGHDIVVIGASSGGVDALMRIAAGLPSDLPASVFIVLHQEPGVASRLPELLSRRGPLRATLAMHGEAIVPGRIYVAPPDNHLMLRPGYMHVVRGPKENGHRPSVDALFRTAAVVYGSRVIGVVLTGYLDCGTAGMMSIKARHGLAVVQDPRDAAVSDMPQSVMTHIAVDHVAPLRDIPGLLARLVAEPAGTESARIPGALMEIEGDEPGVAAEIVCPTCQGKLTESRLDGFQLFRCHIGHAFSLESIAAEQADEVERALWAALRALEEGAALARRLAASTKGQLRQKFEEKVDAQAQQAQVIRRILLRGESRPEAMERSTHVPEPTGDGE